jgi:hypothetical protein
MVRSRLTGCRKYREFTGAIQCGLEPINNFSYLLPPNSCCQSPSTPHSPLRPLFSISPPSSPCLPRPPPRPPALPSSTPSRPTSPLPTRLPPRALTSTRASLSPVLSAAPSPTVASLPSMCTSLAPMARPGERQWLLAGLRLPVAILANCVAGSRPGYSSTPRPTPRVLSAAVGRSSLKRASVPCGPVSVLPSPATSSRAPSSSVDTSSSSSSASTSSATRRPPTTAPLSTSPLPLPPSSSPTLPCARLRPPVFVSFLSPASPTAWSVVFPRS